MQLSVKNDLTNQPGIQQTYLSAAISPGGTVAPVRNIAGLTNQWALQIGQTGEETAEIINIAGLNGGTVSVAATPSHTGGTVLFGHNQDSPAYQIHYDQIIFNRSTLGTIGPFNPIATVSITPDSPYTTYDDPSGAASYAYFVQYYNSLTTDTSGSSSVFLPGGPAFYSLQKLRSRVKDKLYAAGYIRSDDLLTDWLNEAYEILVNSAIKVNQGYMLGTAGYGFGTAGYGTITDSYFKQAVKVEVTYDGLTYLPSRKINPREYTASDYFGADNPRHAWIGETVFEILPHTSPGTARITYASRFTPLVNDADELTPTLKAYTTAFVEYVLSVAYGLDQKDTQQQEHFQKFIAMQNSFIAEITPRDETGAQTIDIVESVSGMDEDVSGEYSDFAW